MRRDGLISCVFKKKKKKPSRNYSHSVFLKNHCGKMKEWDALLFSEVLRAQVARLHLWLSPDISRPEVTLSNKACSSFSSSSPLNLSLFEGLLAIFVTAFSYDVLLAFFDESYSQDIFFFPRKWFVLLFWGHCPIVFFRVQRPNVQFFWQLFDIIWYVECPVC